MTITECDFSNAKPLQDSDLKTTVRLLADAYSNAYRVAEILYSLDTNYRFVDSWRITLFEVFGDGTRPSDDGKYEKVYVCFPSEYLLKTNTELQDIVQNKLEDKRIEDERKQKKQIEDKEIIEKKEYLRLRAKFECNDNLEQI